MKKNALRFAIGLLFSLLAFLPIVANAQNSNSEKYNVAMVVKLCKFLTTESEDSSKDFDINSDGKINVIDLTLLKQYVLYGTSSFIHEETTTTSTTTTPKVTTSTTAKSTTKATSTTTKKVTSTTTKASTTTKTSTTTTRKTTTTTKLTTTTTVTVTTTTTVPGTTVNENQLAINLIDTAIQNVSVKDTSIPKYSGDLYEAKEAIFLFKRKNNTYAYTLLSDSEYSATRLLTDITLIKGIHCWPYSGKEKAVSIYEDLPDTEGLTFHAVDPMTTETEFEYELEEYSSIFYSEIGSVAKKIVSKQNPHAFEIATYDYNLSGELDIGDIEIMIRYLTSETHNLFWKLNLDALDRYTKKINLFDNHTNVVLLRTDSTTPVPFAFNIPTADLSNSSAKSLTVPVQILPSSFANDLAKYEENTDFSDATADYFAWDYTTKKWSKVSSSSSIWKFQAGYYVFVLDEDGNNCCYLLD